MKDQTKAARKTPGTFMATIIPSAALAIASLISGLATMDAFAGTGDHAAFEAAATACGLPKPGSGTRPTADQESCMAKAGFSRPPRGHHGPPPVGREDQPPADSNSSSSSDSATAQ